MFKFNFIPGTQTTDPKGNNQAQFDAELLSVGDTVLENSNGTEYVVGTIKSLGNGARRSVLIYAKHLPYLGVELGGNNLNQQMTFQATVMPMRPGDTVPSILVTSVLASVTSTTTEEELSEFNAFFGATAPVDAAAQ